MTRILTLALLTLALVLAGCAHPRISVPVVDDSVEAGGTVQAGGKPVKLLSEGGVMKVGKPIAPFLKGLDGGEGFVGKVAIINIVPSIDTAVCEEQSHVLSESKTIAPGVARVSISRDLPMAQARFAKDAKLTNISYISDFKTASFGKSSGLIMDGSTLLARAIVVVDKQGIIRHMQIVPNVATLPNLEKAIVVANNLENDKK